FPAGFREADSIRLSFLCGFPDVRKCQASSPVDLRVPALHPEPVSPSDNPHSANNPGKDCRPRDTTSRKHGREQNDSPSEAITYVKSLVRNLLLVHDHGKGAQGNHVSKGDGAE